MSSLCILILAISIYVAAMAECLRSQVLACDWTFVIASVCLAVPIFLIKRRGV